jgi:hypothetical protein
LVVASDEDMCKNFIRLAAVSFFSLAFPIFNGSTSVIAQTGAVNYDGLTNREAISFENITADILIYCRITFLESHFSKWW